MTKPKPEEVQKFIEKMKTEEGVTLSYPDAEEILNETAKEEAARDRR